MDSNGRLVTIRLQIRSHTVAMCPTCRTLTNQDIFPTLVFGEWRIAPLGSQRRGVFTPKAECVGISPFASATTVPRK
jgi:hypothetical protein